MPDIDYMRHADDGCPHCTEHTPWEPILWGVGLRAGVYHAWRVKRLAEIIMQRFWLFPQSS